jgi:hypothetical protein
MIKNFYGNGNVNHELETGFLVHERITSAFMRVDFVGERMYIIPRGHWCSIIILNVHASAEDKIENIRDSFYEELECVFDDFPKYQMKLLSEDFNAIVGKEDIFKPTTGNKSLH